MIFFVLFLELPNSAQMLSDINPRYSDMLTLTSTEMENRRIVAASNVAVDIVHFLQVFCRGLSSHYAGSFSLLPQSVQYPLPGHPLSNIAALLQRDGTDNRVDSCIKDDGYSRALEVFGLCGHNCQHAHVSSGPAPRKATHQSRLPPHRLRQPNLLRQLGYLVLLDNVLGLFRVELVYERQRGMLKRLASKGVLEGDTGVGERVDEDATGGLEGEDLPA